MCGILLMNQNPPIQSPSTSISPLSCGNGTCMPATNAVNRLIVANELQQQQASSSSSSKGYQDELTARECLVAAAHSAHWPWKAGQNVDEEPTVENLTRCKASDLFEFPAIAWSFSDDDEDFDDDDSFSGFHYSGRTAFSAPAEMNCYIETRRPRRGSLVRSISLVSSIMKELNYAQDCLATSKKRMTSSFKAQDKRRTKAKTNRLVALTHPTSLGGLQASHHTGAGKFFL